MRIISFSHVPTQPFWAVPVQALAPWINRIKNSLGHIHNSTSYVSQPQSLPVSSVPAFVHASSKASNDSYFEPSPEKISMPPHSQDMRESSRGTLRVVRESDAGIKPDCAGRMVISGRMADVCAELDRMALLASAHSAEA
jgi:hypothetical protein